MSAVRDTGVTLDSLLDAIDDGKLRRVVGVIEASGQRPVLEPALAALRPRLRQLRPQRPLTLHRLLTVPLERSLVDDDSPHAASAICRGRLRHWQAVVLEQLDPGLAEAATAAIDGATADDRGAIMAAGPPVWSEAGKLLATGGTPVGAGELAAEQHRVADCLALGPTLVPLLDQLLPLPTALDPEDKELVLQLVELAREGPRGRLAMLLSVLLRGSRQPWRAAGQLLELAGGVQQTGLRRMLEQLLRGHRAALEQLVEHHAQAADVPLSKFARDVERLAEALAVGDRDGRDSGAFGPGDTTELRRRAATLATDRWAAAIETVLAPLPPAQPAGRRQAQKAREAEARALATLGRAAQRLASDAGATRLIEAAIERLVDVGEARTGGQHRPVSVENARLIEILAGPDVAWCYLRPDAGFAAGPVGAQHPGRRRPLAPAD